MPAILSQTSSLPPVELANLDPDNEHHRHHHHTTTITRAQRERERDVTGRRYSQSSSKELGKTFTQGTPNFGNRHIVKIEVFRLYAFTLREKTTTENRGEWA